jgi:hypothetical protein
MPSPSIAGFLTKPRNCNSAAEPKKADLRRIPRMTRSFAARLGRFSSNKQHIASCDGRYVAFQMAEVAISRYLFAGILRRISDVAFDSA